MCASYMPFPSVVREYEVSAVTLGGLQMDVSTGREPTHPKVFECPASCLSVRVRQHQEDSPPIRLPHEVGQLLVLVLRDLISRVPLEVSPDAIWNVRRIEVHPISWFGLRQRGRVIGMPDLGRCQ